MSLVLRTRQQSMLFQLGLRNELSNGKYMDSKPEGNWGELLESRVCFHGLNHDYSINEEIPRAQQISIWETRSEVGYSQDTLRRYNFLDLEGSVNQTLLRYVRLDRKLKMDIDSVTLEYLKHLVMLVEIKKLEKNYFESDEGLYHDDTNFAREIRKNIFNAANMVDMTVECFLQWIESIMDSEDSYNLTMLRQDLREIGYILNLSYPSSMYYGMSLDEYYQLKESE